jgi:hypothetical protein
MDIREWEQRYRLRERAREDFATEPVPLLAETACKLSPLKGPQNVSYVLKTLYVGILEDLLAVIVEESSGQRVEIRRDRERQQHQNYKCLSLIYRRRD